MVKFSSPSSLGSYQASFNSLLITVFFSLISPQLKVKSCTTTSNTSVNPNGYCWFCWDYKVCWLFIVQGIHAGEVGLGQAPIKWPLVIDNQDTTSSGPSKPGQVLRHFSGKLAQSLCLGYMGYMEESEKNHTLKHISAFVILQSKVRIV